MPAACSASGLIWTVSSRSTLPGTSTTATPGIERNSRVMPGSARRVSSPGVSVFDDSANDTIGRSVSLNFLMIGSSISAGRSCRIPEMASRMSCVASASGLSNRNSTNTVAKPSSAVPLTFFTPAMDEMASSTGSRISFSTPSGDAPGYGMATVTNGGAMSGNSSVCSFASAIRPKTTSDSIDTTVTMGRLMAKSEMNIS